VPVAMSALTRWALRMAVCLTVAVISSCGTLAWMANQSQPKPPLTAGLTGEWKAVSMEFDRRVKASFVLGTPIMQMGNELQKQGFSRQDWNSSIEQEHVAMRREDNFACRQAAYVHWRADGTGRLVTIKGDYLMEGCL